MPYFACMIVQIFPDSYWCKSAHLASSVTENTEGYLWLDGLNIAINHCNPPPKKMPVDDWEVENWQIDFKIYMEMQRTKKSGNNVDEERKLGSLPLPDIKIY